MSLSEGNHTRKSTHTTFNKTVLKFNSLLSQQRYTEALAFYADDIVSTDSLHSPITGIAHPLAGVASACMLVFSAKNHPHPRIFSHSHTRNTQNGRYRG